MARSSRLPALLRLAALVVALGGFALWATAGAHRGWSMNQVPTTQVDEITGIEYVTYEERFVPGVEVLVGAVVLSALLLGASALARRRPA